MSAPNLLNNIHDFSPNSVQTKFRPVLQEERIPDKPMVWGDGSFEDRWWIVQITRCKYGWMYEGGPDDPHSGTWLNPIYYFYLNFVTVTIKPDGTPIETAPLYLDTDHEVFDLIYFNQYIKGTGCYANNIVIAKGRRKHWTFITHCGVMLWDFVCGWGNVAIGYPQEDPYMATGSELFMNSYNALHDVWKADVLDPDTKYKKGYGIKRKDETTGKETVFKRNFIMFSPMDKKFDRFRGQNLWRVLFDEAGVYRNLVQCYGATKDCCQEGTFRFGQILIGGTSDAIENKSTDYRKMYFEAYRYDAVTHFIPCYRCAPPDVDWENGISLADIAKPKYEARRARIKGDPEVYYKELQENPMNPKECFLPPSKSNYPAHKLDDQAVWILDNYKDKEIVRGRLDFVGPPKDQKVQFTQDELGPWEVYRNGFPTPNVKKIHIMGVDDVYEEGDAPFSDSECSIVIYRELDHRVAESDLFVAVYLARPGRSKFHIETMKAAIFWDALVMLENNDGVLEGKFIKKNLGDRLMTINGKVGFKGQSEVWTNKMTGIGDEFFNENKHEKIYFLSIIDAFKTWRIDNTDVGSAAHAALLGVDQRQGIGSETNKEQVERTRLVMGKIGRTQKAEYGTSKKKKWFSKANA